MLQSWHANCYWILAFITLKHAWSVDSCPLGGALWGWPRAGGWQMEGCRWGAGLPGWPFHPHAVAHSGGRWRARQRLFVALVCTVYTHMCKFTSVLLDAYFARLAQQNHVYAWECIGWISTCLVHLCSMMFAHLVNAEYRTFLRRPSSSCARPRTRLLGFVIHEIHGVCIECMMMTHVSESSAHACWMKSHSMNWQQRILSSVHVIELRHPAPAAAWALRSAWQRSGA